MTVCLQKKKKTVSVKPVCIQTDTKAARHSDSQGVWGNVSALITHLFWEKSEREKKRASEMKSEKVTSAPQLKWLLQM